MGNFLTVSVQDTGVGIAPDQTANIFEPFCTTKEVGKGTGLGLSQVFGFTKQSGGEVDVTSEPGQGATFTLYLPHTVGGEVQEVEGVPSDLGHSPKSLCVLIVEDNDSVGRFADEMLRDLGHKTRLVGSAQEALSALHSENAGFDIVFSDVIMPGMNGVELAREIRRRYADLPVVLTSGYSSVLAEESVHDYDLSRKPYFTEELSRKVTSIVRV